MRRNSVFFGLAAFAISLASTPLAHATLGQAETSVDADCQKLAGSPHARTVHPSYAIREFATHHLTVREYVSQTSGKVYAIVWTGRQHPSLSTLLGSYLPEYQHGAQPYQQQPRSKFRPRAAHSRFTTENLVVERGGRFGAVSGRIYIPSDMPKDRSVDEIQ